jgi:hypothetical protein
MVEPKIIEAAMKEGRTQYAVWVVYKDRDTSLPPTRAKRLARHEPRKRYQRYKRLSKARKDAIEILLLLAAAMVVLLVS